MMYNETIRHYEETRPDYVVDSTGKKYQLWDLFDPRRSRVSFGNGKTRIASVNLLAGDINAGYSGYLPAVLRDLFGGCPGTCKGNCPGCFAMKTTRNIIPAIKTALNTMEALSDPARFVSLVEAEIFGNPVMIPGVVRVHDSGDFFSLEYLEAVAGMIRRHPETRFGSYTKEEETAQRFGLDRIPDNFSLSCSPWEGHCNPIGDLPQFIYDAGDDPEISSLPHCPAVDKTGHRTGIHCADCLHCYFAKRGDRIAVYPH